MSITTLKRTRKTTTKSRAKATSKRRRASRKPDAAASREKIVRTALRLFAERGFHGVSIRDLAKEADISLGLMYNYFKGKEALLHYIFSELFRDIQLAFEVNDFKKDKIAAVIRKSLRSIHAKNAYYKLFYKLKLEPEALAELANDLEQWEQQTLDKMTAVFAAENYSHPASEAKIFLAILDGIGHRMVMHPDESTEAMEKFLISKYEIKEMPITGESPAKEEKANKTTKPKSKAAAKKPAPAAANPIQQGSLF